MAGGNLPFGLAPSGSLTSYTPTLRERATDWVRRTLFSDDREGQGRAAKVMDVVSVTPFGFGLDVYDAGREAGLGNYGTAGLMLGMAGAPGPGPRGKPFGFTAYHGSPHDFDRFDMSKIGTGEGAQAYGHGLYFAETEDVARQYRDTLAKPEIFLDGNPFVTSGNRQLDSLLTKHGGDLDNVVADLTAKYERFGNDADLEVLQAAEGLTGRLDVKQPTGSMYEVKINADPDAFLDWDKPLSEQPARVREALAAMDPDMYAPSGADYDPSELGQIIYQRLASQKRDYGIDAGRNNLTTLGGAQAGATEDLKGFGIPGIKYLDAGSRYTPSNLPNNPIANEARQFLDAAQGDGEKALQLFRDSNPVERWAGSERDEITKVIKAAAKPVTRNYVVFDDKLISIVRKYGIAGASAMLGYNILDGMDPAQADELKRIEGNQ